MNLVLNKKRRALALVIAAFGIASLGDDCDGDIVNDPTFRDWCGSTLCDWTLDVGSISQTPTWSAEDLGVSFEKTPTQISQVTSESSATCILFTAVANTDPSAQMILEVDFNNDGTIDSSQPIDGTWTQVQNEITAPADYSGITFHIRKEGTGTAVLAEMRIQSTTGCTAAPPALNNLYLGETCQTDSQCASGFCSSVNDYGVAVCAGCSSGADCAHDLCEDGLYQFSQCSPGLHDGLTGAMCVTDSDCKSGQCNGASFVDTFAPGDGGADDASAYTPSACRLAADDGGTFTPSCPAAFGVVKAGSCN